jgi:hypothetical protein
MGFVLLEAQKEFVKAFALMLAVLHLVRFANLSLFEFEIIDKHSVFPAPVKCMSEPKKQGFPNSRSWDM